MLAAPAIGCVGRPIEFRIVNDDQSAIFGMMIIELHQVSAGRHRELERGQRVLRGELAITAMADDKWPSAADKLQSGQVGFRSVAVHGVKEKTNREAG